MQTEPTKKGQIQHYVMFWLKPQLSKAEVSNFANFFETLKKISYIKTLSYGLAAHTPVRPVTDNSFTYSLTLTFDSLEDHNAYQEDEIHLDAVAEFSQNWYRVVVHDTVIL
ncbi:stress responsive alpha-beta barrel domain-containing protein [Pedobacter yonginense]|uniref:Stress responsive alpha-beta barrel domain-containing protein n=1 Tax=Pedobacter yonginense TaxID=651869 RepID=A0A317EWH4_9SPHI|nr:Dabb family protein [Pedobacter yonginense]PWS29576.1 stress responsive alpha-beta barrel domain-containing protein [Pedobacter yonginense]